LAAEKRSPITRAPFCANDPLPNTLRLSFVTALMAKIRIGVKVLAQLVTAYQ
jgi:hypothetical protein